MGGQLWTLRAYSLQGPSRDPTGPLWFRYSTGPFGDPTYLPLTSHDLPLKTKGRPREQDNLSPGTTCRRTKCLLTCQYNTDCHHTTVDRETLSKETLFQLLSQLTAFSHSALLPLHWHLQSPSLHQGWSECQWPISVWTDSLGLSATVDSVAKKARALNI